MTDRNGANGAIAITDYWKSTIFSCETALSLLSQFEHKGYYLVDDVMRPLRQLVGRGRNYEAMKAYKPPQASMTSDASPRSDNIIGISSSSSNNATTNGVVQQQLHQQPQQFMRPPGKTITYRKTVQLNFNPRTNWDIEDKHTIHVRCGSDNNATVTCKAITTVEQLDKAMPTIRGASCLALDCEFLGMKKALPELQVLQIAVSTTLGYAIMVNHIGGEATYQRLGPILEEAEEGKSDRVLMGWAFRADAQAIEAAFKRIKLAHVLDLQAKMKAAAVEQLSLSNAMARYCPDWFASEEFSKAKQLGDTFQFLGPDCVWLNNPLPPEALVYAVFDVVSLVELHEKTKGWPSGRDHYWPHTVILTSGRKALEKWYRQRFMAQQEDPNPDGDHISLVETPATVPPAAQRSPQQQSRKKAGKARMSSLHNQQQPTENKTHLDWDDENPQYAADMEEAIRRSMKELVHEQQRPTEERVIGTLDEASGSHSSFHSETIDYDNMPVEHSAGASSAAQINDQQSYFTEEVDEDPVFEAPSDELHFAADIYDDTPRKTDIGQLGGWGADDVEETDWTSGKQQQSQKQQQQPQPQSSRTYQNAISQAYSKHAQGEFDWSMRPEDVSWNQLAKSSLSGWDKNQDTVADWEEIERRNAERQETTSTSSPQEQQQQKTARFHTVSHHQLGSWAREDAEDGWDKQEEQPQSMSMPMHNFPKIKLKNKQRGPRVVNPDISGCSDESDSDYSGDSSSESSADSNPNASNYNNAPGVQVEDTYQDDLFLEDNDCVHVHLISQVAQLSALDIDIDKIVQDKQGPVMAFITPLLRQVIRRDDSLEVIMKGIQIYILDTKESYTILTDRVLNRHNEISQSVLGRILTAEDPGVVTRVVWGMPVVHEQFQQRLGFTLGSVIDLAWAYSDVHGGADAQVTFGKALDIGLRNSKNRDIYNELTQKYYAKKKFSASPWDQERLQSDVLFYSAIQGFLLRDLYHHMLTTMATSADLQQYVWPPPLHKQIDHSIQP